MLNSLFKLEAITPFTFDDTDVLLEMLQNSETVQQFESAIEANEWTLDAMQVLIPIVANMMKQGLIEEEKVFGTLTSDTIDADFVRSYLLAEFGSQPYAWLLVMQMKEQVREGKRSVDKMATKEELEDFNNNALLFILTAIRSYLFS